MMAEVGAGFTAVAVNEFLDHIETLFSALRQRRMSEEQNERFARLLQSAERDCLDRLFPVQDAA
jgi:hypothetical protein